MNFSFLFLFFSLERNVPALFAFWKRSELFDEFRKFPPGIFRLFAVILVVKTSELIVFNRHFCPNCDRLIFGAVFHSACLIRHGRRRHEINYTVVFTMYTERPGVAWREEEHANGRWCTSTIFWGGGGSKIVLKYINFSSLLAPAQTGTYRAFDITESGFDKKKKK